MKSCTSCVASCGSKQHIKLMWNWLNFEKLLNATEFETEYSRENVIKMLLFCYLTIWRVSEGFEYNLLKKLLGIGIEGINNTFTKCKNIQRVFRTSGIYLERRKNSLNELNVCGRYFEELNLP